MNDIREIAKALGLEKLTDEHLIQLERILRAMEGHVARVPRDLPGGQEPFHVFRAKGAA
jgi:hypothetical protein